MTIEFVLDSQAWIEYFQGSAQGQRVRTILEQKNSLTPTAVIAELSNFFVRKEVTGWNNALSVIQSKTIIANLNVRIAEQAGALKFEIRNKFKNNFSLIDAMILATAREHNARVVTGDRHFKELPETIFLE